MCKVLEHLDHLLCFCLTRMNGSPWALSSETDNMWKFKHKVLREPHLERSKVTHLSKSSIFRLGVVPHDVFDMPVTTWRRVCNRDVYLAFFFCPFCFLPACLSVTAAHLFFLVKSHRRRKESHSEKCCILCSRETPLLLRIWCGGFKKKEFPYHAFSFVGLENFFLSPTIITY